MIHNNQYHTDASWFWLLLLLLIAGLFLYIGNGVIDALLEQYDNKESSPAFLEDFHQNLYNQLEENQNNYLFCDATLLFSL
ncbi:MAG: hypothetical protein HFI72_06365 [Peptococcaceae bacterium]|nr:hypothetical protein [Peptococcaceae bacterium]